MTHFGYLLGFGNGEGEMKQFYFNFLFTAFLLALGVGNGWWTDGGLIGLIIFFAIVDVVSYTVFLNRAKSKLFVYENGITGTSTRGLFGSFEFTVEYNQVMSVSTKRNAVVLQTSTGTLNCIVKNTAQLEAQIKERLTALAAYSNNGYTQ